MERVVADWLSLLEVKVSKKYLRHQLRSHPDFPSMLSITETLSYLNIDSAALVLEKESVQDFPVPFLIHVDRSGGEFILIKDVEELLKDNQLLENWSGIVVAAQKPQHWNHRENEIWLKKEKNQSAIQIGGLVCLAVAATISLLQHYSVTNGILMITSVSGLMVSLVLVIRSLGISNHLVDKLCDSKQLSCNAVLFSPASRFGGISWSDVGLIYFASQFLILITSLQFGLSSNFILLSVMGITGVFFTPFSIYYQWKLRSWCRLCLIINTLIWIQAAVFIAMLQHIENIQITAGSLWYCFLIIAFLEFAWMFILQPLAKVNQGLTANNLSLLQVKRNTQAFLAVLQQQHRVDTSPLTNEIQIGNALSNWQIIVACNPYCTPCAQTHFKLDELLEKYPDIGISLRFVIPSNTDDIRSKVVIRILQHIMASSGVIIPPCEFARMIMHEWFSIMDLQKFSTTFPDNGYDPSALITAHEKWSNDSDIRFTPTIFLNGYELPRQYNVDDLLYLLPGLREMEVPSLPSQAMIATLN